MAGQKTRAFLDEKIIVRKDFSGSIGIGFTYGATFREYRTTPLLFRDGSKHQACAYDQQDKCERLMFNVMATALMVST